MPKHRVKKVPCGMCSKKVDPRGLYAHRRTHEKQAQSSKRQSEMPVAQELSLITDIIETFQSLPARAQHYIKARILN